MIAHLYCTAVIGWKKRVWGQLLATGPPEVDKLLAFR
jgi:hypothetical protein